MKTRIVEFNSNGKFFYKVQVKFMGFWSQYLYRDGETGYGDVWKKLKKCEKFRNSLSITKKILD